MVRQNSYNNNKSGNSHEDKALANIVQQVLNKDYSQAMMALSEIALGPKVGRSSLAVFNSVVHALGRSGDPAGAGWVIEQMQLAGLVPNVVTFNSVIDANAQLGHFQGAELWLERMKEATCTPNAISYNTMVKACSRARNMAQAEKWLYKMQAAGFSPCIVTFTTIIGAFAKCGMVDKVEELFGLMKECHVQPDAVIYNILINACAQASMPGRAEGWAQEMSQKGLKADEKTYNSLINACARAADLPQAERWLQRMDQADCPADAVTLGSVLHACAKVGDATRAEMWIQEMQRRGIQPNLICLNTVVHACAQAADSERAEFWFNRVCEVGTPNAVSYNTVMEANAKCGNFRRVGYWLVRMVSKGIAVDNITQAMLQRRGDVGRLSPQMAAKWSYMVIIIACTGAGDRDNAQKWIDRMCRARVTWSAAVLDRCMAVARSSGALAGLDELDALLEQEAKSFAASGPPPERCEAPGIWSPECKKVQTSTPPSLTPVSFPWSLSGVGQSRVPPLVLGMDKLEEYQKGAFRLEATQSTTEKVGFQACADESSCSTPRGHAPATWATAPATASSGHGFYHHAAPYFKDDSGPAKVDFSSDGTIAIDSSEVAKTYFYPDVTIARWSV